tara:strand:+ start:40040 stop:40234 length:195 start_codon:yes stop_codon:yes gene_type:complete
MSLFLVKYELDGDKSPHKRYYHALDKQTARAMFNETCRSGSLTGCTAKVLEINIAREKNKKNEK